jgi:hypothetical protein
MNCGARPACRGAGAHARGKNGASMRTRYFIKFGFCVGLLLMLILNVPATTFAAAANEWIIVEKDDNQTVLVDRASVKDRGDGVRQAWVQFSYSRKTPEGATSSVGLFHFVRNPDRLRNIQDALFDAYGNSIYVRRPEQIEDWSTIPPDTTGQSVIDYVYSVQISGTADGK